MKLMTLVCIEELSDEDIAKGAVPKQRTIHVNPSHVAVIEPKSDDRCIIVTGYEDQYTIMVSATEVKSLLESFP